MWEIPGSNSATADAAPDPGAGGAPVRMQAVGLLAAGLAHDLNTIIASISALAELAAERLPEAPPPELQRIVDQSARAAGLIRELLAFSRQETLAARRIDLGCRVAGLAPVLRALVGRPIALHLAMRRGVVASIDPQALERVLLNLVANAADAIGRRPGRIEVTLDTRGGEAVPPSARGFVPAADYAVLTVADDGPGVPPAIQGRIFEPYFTTKAERGATYGGQGLGLATAYGLVKQSGGFLLLEPERRRGAAFSVWLPRLSGTAEELPAPPAAPAGQAGPGRGRLLLVEDEPMLREATAAGLARGGWAVQAVEDGEAALAAFARAPAEILVSDIRMPGMDGVTLAHRLRERAPGLPVLLVSGYAGDVERESLAALDAGFLAKPFRVAELRERVAALVGASLLASPPARH